MTRRDTICTMLRLFNTISQTKEEFIPQQKGTVTMYVCGITPYDTTHLGHAFTYITFDALVKYLQYKGNDVRYTQNVTDINDRDNDLLKRAREQGVSWEKLASFWTDKFLQDMTQLHWTKPTHYLWASKEIPSMITLIQKILANGYAYSFNGSVYLDVTKYPRYGVLSKLSIDDMLARAKEFDEDIDNPEKKHPLDITLWRATTKNQPIHIPSFESPFGPGRPGWHIECSAMALSSLVEQTEDGESNGTIDLHGGGIDLIYPHHESEITQSETATGKVPFANYWMHVALVQKDNVKMSKSLGNLVMVSDLLKKYSANAIRFMLLSHHYRTSWNFDESELALAQNFITQLKSIIHPIGKETSAEDAVLLSSFHDAMDDDVNTPKALEILRSALYPKALTSEQKRTYAHIASVLGFVF